MWLFIFLLMVYFLTSAFFQYDQSMLNHTTSNWSYHPWYSIYHYATRLFTKRQRWTVLFMTYSIYSVFLAVFTDWFEDSNTFIKIFLFSIGAVFFAKPFIYIAGFLLNRHYNAWRTYFNSIKVTEDFDAKLRA